MKTIRSKESRVAKIESILESLKDRHNFHNDRFLNAFIKKHGEYELIFRRYQTSLKIAKFKKQLQELINFSDDEMRQFYGL